MSSPKDHASDLNAEYERLHTAKEDAFWVAYMGLADDHDEAHKEFDRLEIRIKRFMQDPAHLERTRAALARAEAERVPEETVTALQGWVRTFEANAIESAEGQALAEELVELEGELARARAKMKLGYQVAGREFVDASSVKLAVMVNNDPSEAQRRAAWEGIKAIESFVLDHGFLDIVKKRNRLGRIMGGEDYYDWRTTRTEGMRKREIFALLDELEERTRETGRRCVEEVKARKGAEAARAWNIRYHLTGDVSQEQDPYFPFGHALARWGRSFAALGIEYRGAEMVLDLLDRKGKFENGFMHGPVPAWRKDGRWRPARIHFTANAIPGMVGSGKRATETLFHEGGHAAHFANIDMPSPCFSQEFAPTSVAFAETQSMFLDSLLDDADWQMRYARSRDGAPIPFELIEKGIRANQASAAWMQRAMFTICYAERALYEIPDDQLTPDRLLKEIREIERRLLFIDDASPRPALAVPHLLAGESSAYYHGYILAQMAVRQTRGFFRQRDGHLLDNPRIGPDLSRVYWQPGNRYRFPEFIRALTGQEVSPAALADHVNQSVDAAVLEADQAVARLGEVPEHTGPIDLNATVRIVHGRDEIASTKAGFAQAADTFGRWIEAQEGPAA
ncbi:MAG: M3 family metallopeptidase [Planctomycetota bacterium]